MSTCQNCVKLVDSGLNAKIDSLITKVNNKPSHEGGVNLS